MSERFQVFTDSYSIQPFDEPWQAIYGGVDKSIKLGNRVAFVTELTSEKFSPRAYSLTGVSGPPTK